MSWGLLGLFLPEYNNLLLPNIIYSYYCSKSFWLTRVHFVRCCIFSPCFTLVESNPRLISGWYNPGNELSPSDVFKQALEPWELKIAVQVDGSQRLHTVSISSCPPAPSSGGCCNHWCSAHEAGPQPPSFHLVPPTGLQTCTEAAQKLFKDSSLWWVDRTEHGMGSHLRAPLALWLHTFQPHCFPPGRRYLRLFRVKQSNQLS